MPNWPKNTRKQKGGEHKLYADLNQLTQEEIRNILCGGKSFDELREQMTTEKPVFVIKWGPPGSGKSSQRVSKEVEKLGVTNTNSMNFTPDLILESFLPFMLNSAKAKFTNMRIRTNISKKVRNYSHAKVLFQKYVEDKTRGYNKNLQESTRNLYNRRKIESAEDQFIIYRMLYDKIFKSYDYWRKIKKNSEEKTIADKMEAVLQEAIAAGVNIQYETMGAGYGDEEAEKYKMVNQFTSRRYAKAGEDPTITVYKNTFEKILGKINRDAAGKIISIDSGKYEDLHDKYNISVIYPILKVRDIVNRAAKRAYKTLYEMKDVEISKPYDKYIELLTTFSSEVADLFGISPEKKMVTELIKEKIVSHIGRYMANTTVQTPNSYVNYLTTLPNAVSTNKNTSVIKIPLHRILPEFKINKWIEEAFQYSVDYLLKQYILFNRIQSVIYISNPEEKQVVKA